MRDHGGRLSFDPRLPDGWDSLTYRITWRSTRVLVTLTASELRLEVEHGELPVPVEVRGESHAVYPDEPVVVALDGHGPRRSGTLGNRPQTGGTRADGSRITAGVPDPMPADVTDQPDPTVVDAPVPEPSITGPE
jgi:alpha,alpha-trehalose phosphorylase